MNEKHPVTLRYQTCRDIVGLLVLCGYGGFFGLLAPFIYPGRLCVNQIVFIMELPLVLVFALKPPGRGTIE